jgi:antitoxin (DNA-binding transcriptional repressor) of toxin-antitoxin stability system
MKTIEMAKAKLPLADYTKEFTKEPLIVTIRGKPIAALVGIKNADIETVSLSNNPRFLALLERSRKKQKTKGGISTEEMCHRLRITKRSARIR